MSLQKKSKGELIKEVLALKKLVRKSIDERLNAIFQGGSFLIWSVNRKYQLTGFNKNFSDFVFRSYGVRPKISDEDNRGDGSSVSPKFQKFWEEKYLSAFKGIGLHFESCFSIKKKQKVWKEIFLSPVYLTTGKIDEVSAIAIDITENKKSELALQESEEKFRNIFESFQDIYFRCDLKGNIIMISPSVLELVGYDPDQVLSKNVTNYYLYNSKTKDLIRQLIKHKSVRNFEASLITQDGRILQCICNVRLIYNQNNKPVEIEGVARDITELKKANQELIKSKEIAERSLKVKERFLANMSHEIRTPMNGIIGMIDIVSSTGLNDEQGSYVRTIKKSSETLLQILNDVLDLSKIEAGKMKLRKSQVSISDVMDKLYTLYYKQALSQHIKLHFSIEGKLPDDLILDETRLLQILSNLTSNAVKFTDSGGTIDIKVKQVKEIKKENKILVKIMVKDTGIGISEENKAKLFDSFSQLDASPTKAYAGTGLGLSISRELCQLMNGDIGVESELGKGSTFWFTFEATVAVAEKTRTKKTKAAKSELFMIDSDNYAGIIPKILLVDDNEVNQIVASTLLKKSGCKVELAMSGPEAIDKVKTNKYDLIFMDIQMPGMDGVTATQKIKAMGLTSLPPIIAMTAYSMREDREKFIGQGLDDYIAKPIKAQALIRKVKSIVTHKKSKIIEQENGSFQKGKVINEEVLDQLRKYGGEEMVASALTDFEEETSRMLDSCEASLTRGDYKDILGNLHTIKGNAGTLGVDKVAIRARKIESNLKKAPYDGLKKDLNILKLEFIKFQDHIHNIIKN